MRYYFNGKECDESTFFDRVIDNGFLCRWPETRHRLAIGEIVRDSNGNSYTIVFNTDI